MFYGQFELDRVLYETFFKEKLHGFFVECGAFDGLTESTCKFFEEKLAWKGLNIEPTHYAFDLLVKNRPYSINENCALSSKTEIREFTNVMHPEFGLHYGNGSLSHSPEHIRELIEKQCSFYKIDVQCVRFVELYNKHSLSNIDLFVLDVEGHEEEALKGILEVPDAGLPKVFCIEHTITGLNNLIKLLSPHYTYHSGQAHNAFFVKNT